MTVPFPLSPTPSYFQSFDWQSSAANRNGVFYVGDTVSFNVNGSAAGPHSSTFESGTNGNVISATDSGTTNKWTTVVGSPTYDTTHVNAGSLAAKIPGTGYLNWEYSPWQTVEQYFRFYLYATANPGGIVRLSQGSAEQVLLLTDGKLNMQDLASAHSTTFTTPIALNQWVRIEGHVTYGTNGTCTYELKLFNSAESSTATETVTETNWNMGPQGEGSRFGVVTGTYGSNIWMDNIAANAASYPGPFVGATGETLTYTIRDYYGTQVSAGTFAGTTFTPTVPAGGWDAGWYRCYLTGSETDAVFGDSYGATNFCVIRDDAHFVPMPAGNVDGGANSEGADYVMKGVLGLGTQRHIISNAASPAAEIVVAAADAVISATYWSDPGAPYADSERPSREQWCAFTAGGYTVPQQAGVSTAVAALYPTVTRFEGPQNEPETGTNIINATTAAHMQSFQAAVHAGDAAAKAIGPSAITITDLSMWQAFGNASGFDYCDEISFHAYNAVTNGDLNLGRHVLDAFVAMLADYGADAKPRWQTESTHVFTSVYGVYHPRRARVPLLTTLLMEQYEIPRERNSTWYDISHGFWDYPSFTETADGALSPQAALGRVLAEETWGKPYASALDFGTPGNNIFVGNVYTNLAGESTVAIMAASYLPDAEVTLAVTGSSGPLVVVDGFGNASSVALTDGTVTVPLTDVPAYVELPTGAAVTVSAWNGQDVNATASGGTASARVIGGVSDSVIADGAFQTNYGSRTGIAYSTVTGDTVPASDPDPGFPGDTAYVLFGSNVTVGRVIIWCGQSWQSAGALVDFDVQTTTDGGSNWSTRATVTNETPSSFLFGTDETNVACQRETFWDEQWIFDVQLPAAVVCNGIRLNVRATSYGGEPDWAALHTGGGQGGYQRLVIQEIGAYREFAPVTAGEGLTPIHPGTLQITPVSPTGLALIPIDPTVLI